MKDKVNANSPSVSVIIPVYNVEQFLCECVDSVIAQIYNNIEIILVDDGATDNSGKMCDEYAHKDSRIKVIHRENGGLSAARNTGLDAATGEYIYFLDSDDYIHKETINTLVSLAQADNSDVVFFDAFVFFTDCEEDPNVYRYERSKKYETTNGQEMLINLLATDEYRTAVPLMLFKTMYLKDNGLYFREGILHEDELFTYLVYNADGIISHCHEQFYARRMRAASIMTGSSMLKRYDSFYKIYFELSDMYSDKKLKGKASQLYLARIARSVLAKYRLLDETDRIKRSNAQNKFKKNVIKQKGFNDLKLKIKCSSGLRNYFYRFLYKIGKR